MRLALVPALLLALAGTAAAQEQMEFTDEQKQLLGAVIRVNGYYCPTAPYAAVERMTGRGPIVRVRCGPFEGGVYEDFGYNVLIGDDGSHSVEELECGQRFMNPLACED